MTGQPTRPDLDAIEAWTLRPGPAPTPETRQEITALVAYAKRLEASIARAAYIADHLHSMIPREAWRDQGGDDGQGHYEGDYWAADTLDEIRGWTSALRPGDTTT